MKKEKVIKVMAVEWSSCNATDKTSRQMICVETSVIGVASMKRDNQIMNNDWLVLKRMEGQKSECDLPFANLTRFVVSKTDYEWCSVLDKINDFWKYLTQIGSDRNE